MISADLRLTRRGFSAETRGHAGEKVCAAVTALMNTCRASLENLVQGGGVECKIEDGRMVVRYAGKRKSRERAAVFFESLAIGLLQIEAAYPDELKVAQGMFKLDSG